jgi:hypothetical protein
MSEQFQNRIRSKIDTTNTSIHDRPLSWISTIGTGTTLPGHLSSPPIFSGDRAARVFV